MKLDLFKQKWIDMVFEGRNKSYGAYELRKQNPKTTMIAVGIGALIFTALLALPLINWGGSSDKDKDKVRMVDMAKIAAPPPPPKPLVPPPPPPPPAPKIDEVKFVKPKVVKKEEVEDEMKQNKDLVKANVGDENKKGQEDGVVDPMKETGNGPPEVKEIEDNTIYTAVEVNAEFPGGIPAFYKFVGSHYKTPEDFEGEGKILVRFVVEKDGSLSDITITRDLGSGTGKEAIRVLKSSPKWKPAIQNGRNVRVYYSLPIVIKGSN